MCSTQSLFPLIDHGISPSSMLVRMLASCGSPIQSAIAGGVSSIADWHGGAGEQLAQRLQDLVSAGPTDADLDAAAAALVADYTTAGRRFEGFGHPQHSDGDPRVSVLLDLAREKGWPAGT